ncbi:flagellar protein FlgN [Pelobacter seleniigenes]|uniref:flagellar protein FlgN n=1 Tax=Pelobacter seleniigenes TaxID=407188 RepID=UPI00068AEC1D|nr:flagellar protein FlgN [Pelobacter seleniigenes]
MTREQIRSQLEALLDLLRQEREKALALDAPGLQEVVAAKEELLAGLQLQQEDVEGMEDLLRQIDHENRRNAFLLWTGLNWVRDMMGFFGKAAMPQVYGGGGRSRTLTEGGRLLSGRV